jgi:hypothetical protein
MTANGSMRARKYVTPEDDPAGAQFVTWLETAALGERVRL